MAAKTSRVRASLEAVPTMAGAQWLQPFAAAESGFRTSAKLVVGGTRRRPTLGTLGGDRRGVDLPGCPIQHEAINAALPALKRFIRAAHLTPYDVPTKRGELKYILLTLGEGGALMCRFVLRSREPLAEIRRNMAQLYQMIPNLTVVSANIHPTHEAIVEGPDEIILSKRRVLDVELADVHLSVSPGSFLQTNRAVSAGLYRQVATWAAEPLPHGQAPQTLWDLYCGIGGFALNASLAGVPEVTGVEVSRRAITSAISSAKGLGLPRESARFICEDAVAWALAQDATSRPDVVVTNPPRRGIGVELARWIEASAIPRVIYSSCNPDTLRTDLENMPSYRGTHARLFDMFPHTDHAEVVLLLHREKS